MLKNTSLNRIGKIRRLFLGYLGLIYWRRLASLRCMRHFGNWWLCMARPKNPFTRRLVTLAIEDDGIHLVVFRGTAVEQWGSLSLVTGLVKDGCVANSRELGRLILTFLNRHQIKHKNVVYGISGFQSLSRIITLPQLPSSVLREAISREAARVMPIAPDTAHILWQVLSQAPGQQKLFVVATPKSNLDSLAGALREGKASGGKAELKPLALARLVNQEQAIIVDIQSRSVDVVIVVQGVPITVRTMNRDEQSPLSAVAADISRTLDFFNRNHPQEQLHSGAPLFLSGQLSGDGSFIELLANAIHYPVMPLEVSLKCPQGFSPEKYAVNIGLALGALKRKRSLPVRGVNINVLSLIFRPHHRQLKLSMASAAILVGMAFIFQLYQMNNNSAVAMDLAQANWYRLNQGFVIKRIAKKEVIRAESVLKEIQTQAESLEKAQETILSQNNGFALPLSFAYKTLPPGLSLDSVTSSSYQMELEGKAANSEALVKYLAILEESGLFSRVRIRNIGRPSAQETELAFSLELTE